MRSEASVQAIEGVYRRRGGDFYRYALARTGDRELAHDAVQEGFARALRRRGSFHGTGPLEAWIARCVINAAHDLRPTADPIEAAAGEVAGWDGVADDTVRKALLGLPVRQREALFLRFYLDFDYATIAETLGIETGTVSATLHAARNALARALQEVRT